MTSTRRPERFEPPIGQRRSIGTSELLGLLGMANYRFQYRTADGWADAGEELATKESTAREAFDGLRSSRSLAVGEYRFKRSDERSSHDWGYLQLNDDGTVILGGER